MQRVESTASPGLVAEAGKSASERSWPALLAILTCWWLPATTARRTKRVSLRMAWEVHVLSIFVVILALFAVTAYQEGVPFFRMISEFPGEIIEEIARHPSEATLVMVTVVASIEGGFLLAAFVLSPWGAVDEPYGQSLKNAVRNVWLSTAVLAPALVFFVNMGYTLSRLRVYDWIEISPQLSALAAPTAPYAAPGTPAGDEFQRQWRAYYAARDEIVGRWRARYPFYRVHAEELITGSLVVGLTYALWVMMRAVGADRVVPRVTRDPMCEACGYNLVVTPMDSRCPECGEPVMGSLGAEARTGAPWERRRTIGRLRAWYRTSVDAVLRPSRLGRGLQATRRVVDHRLFLVGHAVMMYVLLQAVIPPAVQIIEGDGNYYVKDIERLYWNEAAATAVSMFAVVLMWPLLCAAVLGAWMRWRWGRNVLAPIMQMASYLSPLLMACIAAVFLALAGCSYWLEHYARSWSQQSPLSLRLMIMLGWLALCAGEALIYMRHLYRGALQARYANR